MLSQSTPGPLPDGQPLAPSAVGDPAPTGESNTDSPRETPEHQHQRLLSIGPSGPVQKKYSKVSVDKFREPSAVGDTKSRRRQPTWHDNFKNTDDLQDLIPSQAEQFDVHLLSSACHVRTKAKGGHDASWIDVKHHCSMGYY